MDLEFIIIFSLVSATMLEAHNCRGYLCILSHLKLTFTGTKGPVGMGCSGHIRDVRVN